MSRVHFVGVAGSGMSALAQFHAMSGGQAIGSDRAFDRGEAKELAEKLKILGVVLFSQDGSALDTKPAEVVVSAAIEAGVPDIDLARKAGITVTHRADYLARYVAEHRTITVAGTSGKSTVAAMIYEILESAGQSPSIITGGALISLEYRGLVGNAFRGRSNFLIVEADESDGTLVRYKPWMGVLLNISKDHKEVAELEPLFGNFLTNSSIRIVNADIPEFRSFNKGSATFGLNAGDLRAEEIKLEPKESRFAISGTVFHLPLPGRYNVENAVAAITTCAQIGVSLKDAAKALAAYQGVARRFQALGQANGVEVIDDFAHNPTKIAAALETAHLRSPRVHAVFQLHGYAPAKFLKQEFIDMFASSLLPGDTLWMPEIYYAGGTASKTISAKEIVDAVCSRGRNAKFFEDRAAVVPELSKSVKQGDVVLVMGARDPSLPEFAKEILAKLPHDISVKT